MTVHELEPWLRESLEGEALDIFMKGANTFPSSKAKAYTAGFLALQKEGFEKKSGKWSRERNSLMVKMEKMTKAVDEKRQVFGFFSIVEVNGLPLADLQGDVISVEDIEKAAYKYVKFSRMGDDRHDERCKATLIESMVFTKEKQQALGIDLGCVGWWGGFEVHDEKLWQSFKAGQYEGFSIGGRGSREELEG